MKKHDEPSAAPTNSQSITPGPNTAPTFTGRLSAVTQGRISIETLRLSMVWLSLGALSIALTVGGYHLGDRYGLLVGFFLALGSVSVVLLYDDMRLKTLFPSTHLEGSDPWGLLSMTRELARRFNTVRPAVKLVESSTPFAFSAGVFIKRSTIFVSTALVHRLTRDEVRAVLAFELARLKLRQTTTATVVSALAGPLAMVAQALDGILLLRFLSRRRTSGPDYSGGSIQGPVSFFISPLIALMMRAATGPSLVLEADLVSAQVLSDNHLLARALWKLDSYMKTRPIPVLLADSHLFIVSPLIANRKFRWATGQPTVETRVRALTGHFPL
jgi:heat shock protein HtpX